MTPSEDAKQSKGNEQGVLGSLPSTRPHRPSARRAAARNAAAKAAGVAGGGAVPKTVGENTERTPASARTPASERTPATERTRAGTASRTRARRAPQRTTRPPRRTPPPPQEPPIPPQGFETEEDIAPGSTVQPPSRPELAAAVADLLGELAQGGLTAGGRLVRDFLGKLPRV